LEQPLCIKRAAGTRDRHHKFHVEQVTCKWLGNKVFGDTMLNFIKSYEVI
jgi:hypothetical protein